MKKIIFTVMITIIIFSSCTIFCKDDKLSLQRQPYNENELRIDGYYYFIHGQKATIYFFFSNGIILHTGDGWQLDNLSEFEQRILSDDFIKKLRNNKSCWGLLSVRNNMIKLEKWYCSDGFCKVYVQEGIILNDTTFHITKSYRSNGSEKSARDELYHFKQFSPKPDSINNFIK